SAWSSASSMSTPEYRSVFSILMCTGSPAIFGAASFSAGPSSNPIEAPVREQSGPRGEAGGVEAREQPVTRNKDGSPASCGGAEHSGVQGVAAQGDARWRYSRQRLFHEAVGLRERLAKKADQPGVPVGDAVTVIARLERKTVTARRDEIGICDDER